MWNLPKDLLTLQFRSMPKLTNISGKKAVKGFLKFGYIHVHTSGDHAILQKTGLASLSIPLHKEVAPFLLKAQIKKANISLEDYIKALK